MIPYMVTNLSSYFDKTDNYYFVNVTTGGYGLIVDDSLYSYEYLTAVLNSKVLDFYLKKISTTFRGGYYAANKQFIEKLPVVLATKEEQNIFIKLTEKMLDLNKDLANSKTPQEKKLLEKQILNTNKQIDKMVYEVYGLNDDQIDIMEKFMDQ